MTQAISAQLKERFLKVTPFSQPAKKARSLIEAAVAELERLEEVERRYIALRSGVDYASPN